MPTSSTPRTALIVGAGPGISASFARKLAGRGVKVVLAARNTDKLATLRNEIGGAAFAVDAADPQSVEALFKAVAAEVGAPDVVLYNASARVRGSLVDLDPEAVRTAWEVSAFGAFLVAQQAIPRMLTLGGGTLLFTGASASLKGFAQSAPFAMGKFALRGLAQSAAREFGPKGIHVAHVIIDGGVRSDTRTEASDKPDGLLDPDAIATSYLAIVDQPRNAWSFEVDLRPWTETF